MRLHANRWLLFGWFILLPSVASAQLFEPLTSLIDVPSTSANLPGTIDIVVEAETYKPAFYRGRAEPTLGNTVRLVAIPLGQASANFTYQWNVGGKSLPHNGPAVTFTDLFNKEMRVSVSVRDGSGALWARAEEVIALSTPQVIFYEENVLRGHGSKAIGETYTLIGDEGVVRAEPYFVGLQSSPTAYQATWKVNGINVDSGGDWRELLLVRPESPLERYQIEFSANNRDNVAERVNGGFNLNFGL